MAMGWMTEGSEFESRMDQEFSLLSRPALRSTQPPIQWVPAVKRLGLETDHSPPTSVEVKNMWVYTITAAYVFIA
jgi:hypothetical protein